MEHLMIPQPDAHALCSRLYTGWHFDAPPKEFCPYLVYATKPVINLQPSLERLMEIHNEQVFGTLPPIESLPVNAFIGMVSFSLDPPMDKSVLTQFCQEPLYRVSRCNFFDRPFHYDHMRQDIDLKAIWPYHSVSIVIRPHYSLGTLSFPVSGQTFMLAASGGSIILDLTQEIRNLILNDPEDEETLKEIRQVCLVCGRRMKFFDTTEGIEIIYEQDANGDPVTYPSDLSPDKRLMRVSVLISCAKPWR